MTFKIPHILDADVCAKFTGDYYGSKSSFNSVTADWTSELSPGKITAKTYNWYDSLVATDGPLSTANPEPKDTFFAKSLFTKQVLTASRWTSFVSYLSNQGVASNTDWFVEIDRKFSCLTHMLYILIDRML